MTSTTIVLSDLAQRRHELGESMSALERAATGPRADQDRWSLLVSEELESLRSAFARHTDLVEGDEGLFDDVIEAAPRLAHRVDAVRAQHEQIVEAIDDAWTALRSDEAGPSDALEKVLALLAILTRHRMAVSDLAWEAFGIDLGSTE